MTTVAPTPLLSSAPEAHQSLNTPASADDLVTIKAAPAHAEPLCVGTDPIQKFQRWRRWMWIAGVPLLIITAIWAWRPLHVQPIGPPPMLQPRSRAPERGEDASPRIDPRLFAVQLWNPEAPPQPTTVAAAPPPPPLNVQLIGIISEGGSGKKKAALYDTDNDRLLIIADGERVRDQTVHIVSEGVVELTDGHTTRRLALRATKEGTS